MITTLNDLVRKGVAVYSKELEAIAITLNDDTRKYIEKLTELPREEEGWTTGLVSVNDHKSLPDWLIVQGYDPVKHKAKHGVKEIDYIALRPMDKLLFVIDRQRKFIRVDVLRG